MKRVIDGRTYDTDTAIYVASGDNFDWSNAWWGLYKAPHGVFFKVAVDHDGSTVREFEPLSDDEARAVLAKHAREPVEQYFGSMSNIGSFHGTRIDASAAEPR